MSTTSTPVLVVRSHPVLAVHDLDRSASFLVDVFGCERRDVGGWAFLTVGDQRFHLGLCPDQVPAAEIGDHNYVAYLDVDDLDEVHRRAVAAGAEVLKPPTDEPWGRREMALRSPEGHRFMVAAAAASPSS